MDGSDEEKFGPKFGYDEFSDLCTSLETGGTTWAGMKSGANSTDLTTPFYYDGDLNRPPLESYRDSGGRAMWMFIGDAAVMNLLRKGDIFKDYGIHADVRGMDNIIFKGVISSFQNMIIVQAPTYFGSPADEMWNKTYSRGKFQRANKVSLTESENSFKLRNGTWQLSDSKIQNCGLRQFVVLRQKDGQLSSAGDALATGGTVQSDLTDGDVYWQGMPDYDRIIANYKRGSGYEVWSRALIIGGNAGQIAWGKMPDYKYQASQDFGITSQSAVEYWFNLQKTKWNPELGGDYDDRKYTNIDWGCIPVDIRIA